MSKTWVKFKKGHPNYSYFVGDVCELPDDVVEGYKGLNELGYTVPATKSEIAAAKAAIEVENQAPASGIRTMNDIVAEQAAQIDELKAMFGKPPVA
jgi:hypothetical protein